MDGVSSRKRKGDGKTTKSARDRMKEGNKMITLAPSFRCDDDDDALAEFVEKNKLLLNEATLKTYVLQGKLCASGARVAPQQRTWRRDGSSQRGC